MKVSQSAFSNNSDTEDLSTNQMVTVIKADIGTCYCNQIDK